MNTEDKKTVHRCDCGHFHETSEMETVTLKIRKGKDCSLETALANLFPQVARIEAVSVAPTSMAPLTPAISTTAIAQPVTPVVPNRYAIPGYEPSDPKVVKLLNAEEKAKFLKESAIPPEFARRMNPLIKTGIGIPSGDPNFESHGAKEIRRI